MAPPRPRAPRPAFIRGRVQTGGRLERRDTFLSGAPPPRVRRRCRVRLMKRTLELGTQHVSSDPRDTPCPERTDARAPEADPSTGRGRLLRITAGEAEKSRSSGRATASGRRAKETHAATNRGRPSQKEGFPRATNRRMENNGAKHTHNNNSTIHEDKVVPSVYRIPSVFFSELVERDRGLRMMLMVRLYTSADARPLKREPLEPSADV